MFYNFKELEKRGYEVRIVKDYFGERKEDFRRIDGKPFDIWYQQKGYIIGKYADIKSLTIYRGKEIANIFLRKEDEIFSAGYITDVKNIEFPGKEPVLNLQLS